MLSLDIGGRALILPQSDMLDFVDSLWEALPCLKSGGGVKYGEGGGNRRGYWGMGLDVFRKINK